MSGIGEVDRNAGVVALVCSNNGVLSIETIRQAFEGIAEIGAIYPP